MFLYACETWTVTAELQSKIQAVEMRCLRRVLGISHTEHITNEAVRANITKHMKRYEELPTTVKKKKAAMVSSCDKREWPVEDSPQRYSSRWKKKGQAEKEKDGQNCREDKKELCHDPSPCP